MPTAKQLCLAKQICWHVRLAPQQARISVTRPVSRRGCPAPFSRQAIRPSSMAIYLIAPPNMIVPLDIGIVLLPRGYLQLHANWVSERLLRLLQPSPCARKAGRRRRPPALRLHALGLSAIAGEMVATARTGKNGRHALAGM